MLRALRKWFCMWAYSLVADLRFFLLPSFMLCITGNHVIFGVNLISVISVKDVFTSFQIPPKVSTEATRKFRLSMPTEHMLMPKRWCNNFTKIWTHQQFYDLQYFAVFSDWCLYFLLIFGCLSLIFLLSVWLVCRITGWDRLVQHCIDTWIQDIKKYQVSTILSGVGPMHTLSQLCKCPCTDVCRIYRGTVPTLSATLRG